MIVYAALLDTLAVDTRSQHQMDKCRSQYSAAITMSREALLGDLSSHTSSLPFDSSTVRYLWNYSDQRSVIHIIHISV